MTDGRVFRGIAAGLTILLLTEACASRAQRPALAPRAPLAAVPLGQVSDGLAVGAEARIEDSRHPLARRVLAVRLHVENRGPRPVALRLREIVLEGDGGTVRTPEEPGTLAGPTPVRPTGHEMGQALALVVFPGFGPVLVPFALVGLGAVTVVRDLVAGRRERLHGEAVRAYDARSFPRAASLEPGQAASGFVFFALAPAERVPGAAPLGVEIEDIPIARDEADDRTEESSSALRTVRIRLWDRPMVQGDGPQ